MDRDHLRWKLQRRAGRFLSHLRCIEHPALMLNEGLPSLSGASAKKVATCTAARHSFFLAAWTDFPSRGLHTIFLEIWIDIRRVTESGFGTCWKIWGNEYWDAITHDASRKTLLGSGFALRLCVRAMNTH